MLRHTLGCIKIIPTNLFFKPSQTTRTSPKAPSSQTSNHPARSPPKPRPTKSPDTSNSLKHSQTAPEIPKTPSSRTPKRTSPSAARSTQPLKSPQTLSNPNHPNLLPNRRRRCDSTCRCFPISKQLLTIFFRCLNFIPNFFNFHVHQSF